MAERWKRTNRSPSQNLLGQGQDSGQEKDHGPTVGDFLNLSGLLTIGPSSRCGRNLTAVVVLWSLTSPYHFSSPAIDSVSVGRRTDKGMCMTLPTDTGDIWVREPLGWLSHSIHDLVIVLKAVITFLCCSCSQQSYKLFVRGMTTTVIYGFFSKVSYIFNFASCLTGARVRGYRH